MAFYGEHLPLVGVIVFLGGMIFLRLVAKEKYRRERYLELRLAEKMRQQEEEEKKAREKAEAAKKQEVARKQPGDSPVITLQHVA